MNPWGSSPWGDNDGQQASGMSGSPFDSPSVQPGAPPVFGDHPGFPPQGWGQQSAYGAYPPQFSPQPPEHRRRNAKAIGLVIAAVIGVLALVGSIVYWMSGSDSGLSEADAAAGKAEIAGVERPPAAAKLSLSAAPTKNLWSYPPGPDSGAYSSVMGGDSKTVIVNLKKSMIALDAENGAPLWQQPLPASFGMAAHCVVGTSGGAALCRGGKEAVLLDMRSGATKASMSADTGVAQVYAGSGLLAFAANKKNLTVFDDAGQQLWTKPITGLASVYLDQGVVAEEVGGTSTKFYDAKSGADLFSIGAVDDLIATSRGIVVSVRGRGRQNSDRFPEQQIDFYSFTGKLAWRIPADRGYRLPDTSLNSTPSFPSSVEYATSGVALPIVYSEGKGEIAAVEPLTGDFKWSQRVPLSPKPSVRLAGVGNLCIVAYGEVGSDTGGVRVRDCTDGTGAFIEKAKLDELVAADNNQIVGRHDGGPTIAYDTATGQPSWQLGDDVGSVTWVGAGLYGNGRGKITRLS